MFTCILFLLTYIYLLRLSIDNFQLYSPVIFQYHVMYMVMKINVFFFFFLFLSTSPIIEKKYQSVLGQFKKKHSIKFYFLFCFPYTFKYYMQMILFPFLCKYSVIESFSFFHFFFLFLVSIL